MTSAETACSSCGVSYLIHSEVTALQRRVAAAEAQVTQWADRIARVKAVEAERDDERANAGRLSAELAGLRTLMDARTRELDDARRTATQAEERFRTRLDAEAARWRALQSSVLSGAGPDLEASVATLREELRSLRTSTRTAIGGFVEAAAAASKAVAPYIEESLRRMQGALRSEALAATASADSLRLRCAQLEGHVSAATAAAKSAAVDTGRARAALEALEVRAAAGHSSSPGAAPTPPPFPLSPLPAGPGQPRARGGCRRGGVGPGAHRAAAGRAGRGARQGVAGCRAH